MKKSIAFSLAWTLLVFGLSCGGKKETTVEEKPIAVTVAAVQPRDIAVGRTYTGTLEGLKQAKLYASIPEAVVELPVAQGKEVEAGQAIIFLDKNGPTARYKQAEATYLDAKDNYEKMGKLFAQGAISQQTYNSVKTAYEVSLANYTSAKQQVELTTPISGILTDLAVNVGQYAPLGVPLATIAQTDKMRLTIYVDSRGASYIRAGQKADITIDVADGRQTQFEGVVSDVAKSADPDTRLFKVEIAIDNKSRVLRPGMFAKAYITVAELKNVLTIPKESVFLVEGVAKVFVLESDHARERTVTVGESTPDLYEITSGLTAGENVIVLGRSQVEDGSLVKIASEADTTPTSQSSKEN